MKSTLKTFLLSAKNFVYEVSQAFVFYFLWVFCYNLLYIFGLYKYIWWPVYWFFEKMQLWGIFMNWGYVAITEEDRQKLQCIEERIEVRNWYANLYLNVFRPGHRAPITAIFDSTKRHCRCVRCIVIRPTAMQMATSEASRDCPSWKCPPVEEAVFNGWRKVGITLARFSVWICKRSFILPKFLGIDRTPPKNAPKNLISGDALNLPFADNSFDILLSVETTHCLEVCIKQKRKQINATGRKRMDSWIPACHQAGRLHLLVRHATARVWLSRSHVALCEEERTWGWLLNVLLRSLLQTIAVEDITDNTLKASVENAQKYMDVINSHWYLRYTRWMWKNFWQVHFASKAPLKQLLLLQMPGTLVHRHFVEEKWRYFAACYRKPLKDNTE